MDLVTYKKEFESMWNKFVEFVDEPSDSKKQEIDGLMRKHIGDSENIRRRVKKHNMHQRELEL